MRCIFQILVKKAVNVVCVPLSWNSFPEHRKKNQASLKLLVDTTGNMKLNVSLKRALFKDYSV